MENIFTKLQIDELTQQAWGQTVRPKFFFLFLMLFWTLNTTINHLSYLDQTRATTSYSHAIGQLQQKPTLYLFTYEQSMYHSFHMAE